MSHSNSAHLPTNLWKPDRGFGREDPPSEAYVSYLVSPYGQIQLPTNPPPPLLNSGTTFFDVCGAQSRINSAISSGRYPRARSHSATGLRNTIWNTPAAGLGGGRSSLQLADNCALELSPASSHRNSQHHTQYLPQERNHQNQLLKQGYSKSLTYQPAPGLHVFGPSEGHPASRPADIGPLITAPGWGFSQPLNRRRILANANAGLSSPGTTIASTRPFTMLRQVGRASSLGRPGTTQQQNYTSNLFVSQRQRERLPLQQQQPQQRSRSKNQYQHRPQHQHIHNMEGVATATATVKSMGMPANQYHKDDSALPCM
ncbi:unnamed protein product [Protopolystoma xenopodis]|uniref:Uncharacterized protein n=1 Tax=Protopolystoma xenopodis TaxID=117903 RepID=A0A3S5B8R0_9PLAT|nr:unnamed protein product [Protopolystoma xenopodis]